MKNHSAFIYQVGYALTFFQDDLLKYHHFYLYGNDMVFSPYKGREVCVEKQDFCHVPSSYFDNGYIETRPIMHSDGDAFLSNSPWGVVRK